MNRLFQQNRILYRKISFRCVDFLILTERFALLTSFCLPPMNLGKTSHVSKIFFLFTFRRSIFFIIQNPPPTFPKTPISSPSENVCAAADASYIAPGLAIRAIQINFHNSDRKIARSASANGSLGVRVRACEIPNVIYLAFVFIRARKAPSEFDSFTLGISPENRSIHSPP